MKPIDDQLAGALQQDQIEPAEDAAERQPSQKKPFVEPTISVPQDVLETTKFFFQAVEAGSL
ncbi:MAG: hypothetical protein HONDAALG_02107 [Gammaproteobacteria bacterium]|nr:hypothetical protein [Gammaproteobacteria bacterium]